MGRPKVELQAGDRYNRWTVLEFAGFIDLGDGRKDKLWKCRCDCGTEGIVRQNALRQGGSRSCGCLKKDRQKARREKERLAKAKTNADRVRCMTDEELAEKFNELETSGRAYGPWGKEHWLSWLKADC